MDQNTENFKNWEEQEFFNNNNTETNDNKIINNSTVEAKNESKLPSFIIDEDFNQIKSRSSMIDEDAYTLKFLPELLNTIKVDLDHQNNFSTIGLKNYNINDDNFECKTMKFEINDSFGKKSEYDLEKEIREKEKKLISNKIEICRQNGKLRLQQPFKILTDIWGVLTSYSFRKELFKYIDDNLSSYLEKNFENEDIKTYVGDLISRTEDDRIHKGLDIPILARNSDRDEMIKSVLENINFRRNHPDKSLMQYLDGIYNLIWNEGYTNKSLRPHVFSDVIPNFKKWHSDPFFIKIYSFASGPIEIQKLFLSTSTEGDVSEFITSGFDAHHRYKYDSEKYKGVLASLNEREAKNLFYFTDSPKKGRAARKSGMSVFIVLREGNRQYKKKDLDSFTTVQSFDEFDFYEFGNPCC